MIWYFLMVWSLLEPECVLGQNYKKIREAIHHVLDAYPSHDDGSIAPIVFRLSWHTSGTFNPHEKPFGGSNGATMRFYPESEYYENRGLELARHALQPIKDLYPSISYSDLWVLAGYAAIEHMGGPEIEFRGGRTDEENGGNCPPEERLPMWDDSEVTIREKFGRMGFGDREIVALIGGHTVGRTHEESSGFPYLSWDNTPTGFDNLFYSLLLTFSWQEDQEGELKFYRNRSWLMLLSDFLLREDPKFRIIAEEYLEDENLWFEEFAAAFKKLTELGLEEEAISPYIHEKNITHIHETNITSIKN